MQTLIENVNIINPFEEIETSKNVLIEDNVIKEISSSKIKADAKVIDGEDNYLLSGFIDCHTHIFAKGFHKEENMANPLGIHFYNAVPHSLQTINAGVTATLTGYATVSPTTSPVDVKIQGTADNVLELSNGTEKKAVQKGDKGTGTLSFEAVPSGSTAPVLVAVSVTVEVTNAGQTVVIAS